MTKNEFIDQLLQIINDTHLSSKDKKVVVDKINKLSSDFFVEPSAGGIVEHNVTDKSGMNRKHGVVQMTKTESQLADEAKGIFVN